MDSITLRVVALVFFYLPLGAHSTEMDCPRVIAEKPTASSPDPLWNVLSIQESRPVESAGIYLGNPSGKGSLVPDSDVSTKKSETVTWSLAHAGSDDFYVACFYTGTTAMLFKKIDAGYKECIASYELLPTGRRQRLIGVVCR